MPTNEKPIAAELESSEAQQPYFDPNSLAMQVKNANQYVESGYDPWMHAELIRMLADGCAAELQVWLSWANELSNEMGMAIELVLADRAGFYATVADHSVDSAKPLEKKAVITIHLGCIPRLLGLANRMVFSARASSVAFAIMNGFEGFPVIAPKWDPLDGPVGRVVADEDFSFSKTARIIIDSIVIMFLHEVSHVIRAHLHHPGVVNKKCKLTKFLYSRAAESDADASAGWLFIAGHRREEIKAVTEEICRSDNNVIHRLALSSVCNYVALQIRFKTDLSLSSPYHFASTRADCIVFGAQQAWLQFGGSEHDFEVNVNEAYQFVARFEEVMPFAIRSWTDRESQESVLDFSIYKKLTLMLIDEISVFNACRRPSCIPSKLSIYSPNFFMDSGIGYTVSFAGMQRYAV